MAEGTQSASENELSVAFGSSHEPNTRVGRKRKHVQKEIMQSAMPLIFSTEQHSLSPNW